MKRIGQFFHKYWESKSLALPVCGGLIATIGFSVPTVWFFVCLGLIPLFRFLYQTISWKHAFRGSFLFGLVYMGGVFWWYWDALPLSWAGIGNSFIGALIIGTVWVIESGVYACCIGLASALFSLMRTSRIYDAVLFASLWIVAEWARACVMTVVWMGPDTLVGPHWTIGMLGYALAENNFLVSFAGVGGGYLVTFIAMCLGFFAYRFVDAARNHARKIATVSLLSICLIFFVGYLIHAHYAHTPTEKTISAAIMQTQIPSSFEETVDDSIAQFTTLTTLLGGINKATKNESVDIIILPEDARFSDMFFSIPQKKGALRDIIGTQNASSTIIDSGRATDDDTIMSRFVYVDADGNTQDVYQKRFLMPFGEFMPYIISGLAHLAGQSSWINAFIKNRAYTPGTTPSTGTLSDGSHVGNLFCSEIMSPILHRDLVRSGAEVLINATSHSALHGSYILGVQQRHIAQMRAAEENRFLLESTNATAALVIGNTGEILYKGDSTKTSFAIYSNVHLIKSLSLYARFGDWIVFLSIGIILFTARKGAVRAYKGFKNVFIHTK
jgi:apolipoprotein N-acyltransferase